MNVLIFIILTIYIFSRLFKVLGDTKYDSNEMGSPREWTIKDFTHNNRDSSPQTINIASKLEAEMLPKDRDICDEIRKYDPSFTAELFLQKTRNIFEFIMGSFNSSALEKIEEYVSKDVFNMFFKENNNRIEQQHKVDWTLVSFKNCDMVSIEQDQHFYIIKVHFITEQITAVYDKNSQSLIYGSPKNIIVVEDYWTFRKEKTLKSKMWKLISIGE